MVLPSDETDMADNANFYSSFQPLHEQQPFWQSYGEKGIFERPLSRLEILSHYRGGAADRIITSLPAPGSRCTGRKGSGTPIAGKAGCVSHRRTDS